MQARLLLGLTVGLLLAADVPDDLVKKEKERLQGTWQIVSAEEDGKANKQVSGFMIFKDDKLTLITTNDKKSIDSEYRLDPAKKPKEIDFTVVIDGKKKVNQAIYSVIDDELRLCVGVYKFDGNVVIEPVRPNQFDSTVGLLITLKREKK
jgi:uncharacterized protein (TIGR03067 family)